MCHSCVTMQEDEALRKTASVCEENGHKSLLGVPHNISQLDFCYHTNCSHHQLPNFKLRHTRLPRNVHPLHLDLYDDSRCANLLHLYAF